MTESVPSLGLGNATLELDRRSPSLRHVLDGRSVENGTILEVQLADGGSLPLRYEARWVEDDGEGSAGLFPRWHLPRGHQGRPGRGRAARRAFG